MYRVTVGAVALTGDAAALPRATAAAAAAVVVTGAQRRAHSRARTRRAQKPARRYNATQRKTHTQQPRHASCARHTPWFSLFATALFVAGLVTWAVCASQLRASTLHFGSTLGVNDESIVKVAALVVTGITAIGITAAVILGLVVLLAVTRTAQRTALWGGCCCDCGACDELCVTSGLFVLVVLVLCEPPRARE